MIDRAYEKLMRKNTAQEEEINKLKHLLKFGNINELEILLEDYVAYSKSQLRRIAIEMQFCEYSYNEQLHLKAFLNYLLTVQNELYKFMLADKSEYEIEKEIIKFLNEIKEKDFTESKKKTIISCIHDCRRLLETEIVGNDSK